MIMPQEGGQMKWPPRCLPAQLLYNAMKSIYGSEAVPLAFGDKLSYIKKHTPFPSHNSNSSLYQSGVVRMISKHGTQNHEYAICENMEGGGCYCLPPFLSTKNCFHFEPSDYWKLFMWPKEKKRGRKGKISRPFFSKHIVLIHSALEPSILGTKKSIKK